MKTPNLKSGKTQKGDQLYSRWWGFFGGEGKVCVREDVKKDFSCVLKGDRG